MPIELVAKEIKRFLSTDEPEVLSIGGDWGVGKTFAWRRYLEDAKSQKNIALRHYAYVSLFGVNSLDELKYSIFEQTVHSTEIGVEPNLKTLRSNTAAVAKQFGRESLSWLQQIPLLKKYVGTLPPIWFFAWSALMVPVSPQLEVEHKTEKRKLLRMEFATFCAAFIQMPCQIVRGGRRLIYRLLSWNPWQDAFLRLAERLHSCWLC